jgi:hypothetical protein
MSKQRLKNPDFTVRGVSSKESKLDSKLLKLICLSLGEASMCWDSPQSAGQFHSKEAIVIAEKLMNDIKDLIRNI